MARSSSLATYFLVVRGDELIGHFYTEENAQRLAKSTGGTGMGIRISKKRGAFTYYEVISDERWRNSSGHDSYYLTKSAADRRARELGNATVHTRMTSPRASHSFAY